MPDDSGPAPKVVRLDLHCLRYPLSAPLRTVLGTIEARPALLVRIEDEDGAEGWGEIWCNFPPPGAEYRARLAAAVLPGALGNADPAKPEAAFAQLRAKLHSLALQAGEPGPADQIATGVDIALHDLAARRAGLRLAEYLGGAVRPIPAYASGLDSREATDLLPQARENGYRAFKFRVGFGADSDKDALATAADLLGEGETLMIDANQSWNVDSVSNLAGALNEAPLAWIEEPIPVDRPAEEWADVAGRLAHRLAGGENFRSADEFERAIEGNVLSVIQPDVCKWGGVSGCLEIARAVIGAGKRYCPHYLGGGLGLLASAHLLSAAGGDGILEIDDNENGLREALAGSLLPVNDGMAELPDGPGLGFTPALETLTEFGVLHFEVIPQ